MHALLDLMGHLPEFLQGAAARHGAGVYLIVGAIVFAETGLVVAPFLPGDSLLFATGALVSLAIPGVRFAPMVLVLVAAAVLGDALNYSVGRFLAKKLFAEGRSGWLKQKHLDRTRAYYDRHGGRTVVLARFLPVVRTYAPFVAGLSAMPARKFFLLSLAGAALWIGSFTALGYWFGNLPAIRDNFHFAILAIIGISFIPVVLEVRRQRRSPLKTSG